MKVSDRSTVDKCYPLRYPAEDKDKENQQYVPDLPEATRSFRDDPRDFKNEQASTDFFSGICGTEDNSLNYDKTSFKLIVTLQ